MSRPVYDKCGLLMARLSTGVYRRWFWANYKNRGDQARFRSEWKRVAERFSWSDIENGLNLWVSQYGQDCSPEPDGFYNLIAPKVTDSVRDRISNLRKITGESNVQH
jgi:hypothetical protein